MPAKKDPQAPLESLPKDFSYQQAVDKLQGIVEQLQAGDAGFEDSITLFSEGSKLLKQCKLYLNQTELTIKQIIEQADGSLNEQPME